MWIVSCSFILLLCLSKPDHCKARHHKDVLQHDLHYSPKVQEYLSRPNVETVDRGQLKKAKLEGEFDNEGHNSYEVTKSKLMKRRIINGGSTKEYKRGKISGFAIKKKNLVSVSWRIPSKNLNSKNPNNEKNPGFYSDYSRPRTRPPSHN